jgi:hypothetical protein
MVWLLAAATSLSGQVLPAGRIKVVTGEAFVVRQNAVIPAEAGLVLFEADGLRTGPNGRLAVTLRDDTRVSLDPGSEVRLDRFAYAPVEGRLALVLNVLRGLVAYVSGHIAKLSPDAVRIETPDAIIGIRGTHIGIRVEQK